jgi:hypothetical protein
MQIVKPPPRFLPTLTEVIPPPKDPNALKLIDADVLLDNVMQSLLPRLQTQLEDALEQMVQDHVQLLMPRLQQEVEVAVRQAIALLQPQE